nr:hypothetical protein OH837_49365 [Streptomyces canus]
MRRPAQQPYGPTARTAWAHPYRGVTRLGVFYNDGGQGGAPATPPTPTPADLAARAVPPAPAPAAQPPNADDTVLLDHGTGQPMTQAAFSKIMARENAKGRRNVLREISEAAGVPFDDNFDVTQFGKVFQEAEKARQERLTEEQKRQEELANRETALHAERTRLEQEAAALKASQATLVREQALIRLGAMDLTDDKGAVTAPNLQDAMAMLERDLRQTPDADPAAVAAAADALKKRRPELFGAAPAAQTLPPAPSGGPAGGNAPRTTIPGKDAVKEAARQRAEAMGLRQAS